MKLLLFGGSGMLGAKLATEAARKRFTVRAFSHEMTPIDDRRAVRLAFEAVRPDVVVNAAGVIPPTFGRGRDRAGTVGDLNVAMVMTNALGPQVLAQAARLFSVPLIHVSTDCVFSGDGDRVKAVDCPPDARDVYGRSKLVGEDIVEPNDRLVTVVRTSFVGFEHGLLAWFVSRALAGHGVEGYRHAWWSGSRASVVARQLLDRVRRRSPVLDRFCVDPPGGIQHLATASPISKDHLLRTLKELFGFSVAITPVEHPYVGRGLVPTTDPKDDPYELPPFEAAAIELAKEWKESDR